MVDKHNPNQPPDPSKRRLFTIFTDRKAAGEVGAELGKAYRELRDVTHELAQAGQDASDALTEAAAPSAPAPSVSLPEV